MADLATIATVLTVGSAVVGAGAAVYTGITARQEADRQAAIDIASGKNSFAAAQREADQRRLEGHLIASRQQAYAAASGAGSGIDDPTILKILSDTGRNTDLAVDATLYQGAQARSDYEASAAARRASGQNYFLGSLLRATGSLAGGIGRIASDIKPPPLRNWAPI